MTPPEFSTDILVIGGGMAGVYFALQAASKCPECSITIVTKDHFDGSNSRLAQGGIACVYQNSEDSIEAHLSDTLLAGDGVCDPLVAETIIRAGAEHLDQIMRMGIQFDKGDKTSIDKVREGGHSVSRVFHVRDHTGSNIMEAMLNLLKAKPHIRVVKGHAAKDLMKDEAGVCLGAEFLDPENRVLRIFAKSTVLATGGAGQCYEYSTNPARAFGDGVAMASAAGAEIRDVAYVQFHPTALFVPGGSTAFLITEAMRGAGAELVNKEGYPFTYDYDPRGPLATRDIVSRAIYFELERSGDPCVFLAMRSVSRTQFAEHFPSIHHHLKRIGIDAFKQKIPVLPAAHYFCGGIKTDMNGATNITGLYAIGECASTGLHGANRLASNSLLEALVMAGLSSDHIAHHVNSVASVHGPTVSKVFRNPMKPQLPTIELVRQKMTQSAGIVRSRQRLMNELKTIENLGLNMVVATREDLELRNVLIVAEEVMRDSLRKRENRGCLYMVE